MDIREEREGTLLVLTPQGRLDTAAAADLQLLAMQLVEAGERRVLVDLSTTSEVSGTALRVLLMLSKRLQGLGGAMAVCGMAEEARHALQVAGLDGAFPVFPGRDAAVAQIRTVGRDKGRAERVAELAARLLGAPHASGKKTAKKSGG